MLLLQLVELMRLSVQRLLAVGAAELVALVQEGQLPRLGRHFPLITATGRGRMEEQVELGLQILTRTARLLITQVEAAVELVALVSLQPLIGGRELEEQAVAVTA